MSCELLRIPNGAADGGLNWCPLDLQYNSLDISNTTPQEIPWWVTCPYTFRHRRQRDVTLR